MDTTGGWTRRGKLGLAGLAVTLTLLTSAAAVLPKKQDGACTGGRLFVTDPGYSEYYEEFRQEHGPCEVACPNSIWEPFETTFSRPIFITGETAAEPGIFMRRQCKSDDYEFRPLTPAETEKMERAARWWEN